MTQPPDPEHMDLEKWLQFLDELALYTLIFFGACLVASLYFYRRAAIAKKIRTPGDVFSAYTPMAWLLGTFVAGGGVAGDHAAEIPLSSTRFFVRRAKVTAHRLLARSS